MFARRGVHYRAAAKLCSNSLLYSYYVAVLTIGHQTRDPLGGAPKSELGVSFPMQDPYIQLVKSHYAHLVIEHCGTPLQNFRVSYCPCLGSPRGKPQTGEPCVGNPTYPCLGSPRGKPQTGEPCVGNPTYPCLGSPRGKPQTGNPEWGTQPTLAWEAPEGSRKLGNPVWGNPTCPCLGNPEGSRKLGRPVWDPPKRKKTLGNPTKWDPRKTTGEPVKGNPTGLGKTPQREPCLRPS